MSVASALPTVSPSLVDKNTEGSRKALAIHLN